MGRIKIRAARVGSLRDEVDARGDFCLVAFIADTIPESTGGCQSIPLSGSVLGERDTASTPAIRPLASAPSQHSYDAVHGTGPVAGIRGRASRTEYLSQFV